jgi:hypothetical protein
MDMHVNGRDDHDVVVTTMHTFVYQWQSSGHHAMQ